MFALIIGILLIVGGLLWSLFCLFASGMADRQVSFWGEVAPPMLIGLFPALLGIGLIVWR